MLAEVGILLHLGCLAMVAAETYGSRDRSLIHTKKQPDRAPYFGQTPDNYTFEAGQLALLKCDVRHLGDRRIGWRRASQPSPLTIGTMTFVDDDRISVEHPPQTAEWNLMIKRVRIEDAGVYECQVASKSRHLRKHVLLKVTERKIEGTKNNIQITGEEFVEQGKGIYLVCNATGKDHSPDDLDWFKNGNKLTTEFARKIYIRKFVSLTTKTIVSILEIKNAKLGDAGVYVCRTSDLQITSRRINVLKTDRDNVKRGTAAKMGENSGCSMFGSVPTSLLLAILSLVTIYCTLDVLR